MKAGESMKQQGSQKTDVFLKLSHLKQSNLKKTEKKLIKSTFLSFLFALVSSNVPGCFWSFDNRILVTYLLDAKFNKYFPRSCGRISAGKNRKFALLLNFQTHFDDCGSLTLWSRSTSLLLALHVVVKIICFRRNEGFNCYKNSPFPEMFLQCLHFCTASATW